QLASRTLPSVPTRRSSDLRFIGLGSLDEGSRCIRIVDGSGEREISARLVVAADGTRSGVREALGIAASEHDYRQTLFVARMRAEDRKSTRLNSSHVKISYA